MAGFPNIIPPGKFLVGTLRFSAYRERHFWGWIMTVFALSHATLVINVPTTNIEGRALLVLFLLALTESNDIAQYLWGNPAAAEKVVPKVSPGKRWKVWWGA